MIRSVIRSPISRLLRSPFNGAGQSLVAQIAALFRNSEQGAWYDPSDWSTLFQDSAGTMPVTAVGQPVGKMLDKSGCGNHASQPTTVNRPILQIAGNGRYYLAFNGMNSWMSTAAIDFTATDKMTIVAGVRAENLNSAIIGMVLNHNSTGFNAFSLQAPSGASGQVGVTCTGSSGSSTAAEGGLLSPLTAVLAASINLASPQTYIRRNGAQKALSNTATGGGNFTSAPLHLGVQTGATARFFQGNLYGLILRGALSSDGQVTSAEKFMNSKTGAY